MKNTNNISFSCFIQFLSNKNKFFKQVLIFIFCSHSVLGQITRSKVVNNALAYTTPFIWTATANNCLAGGYSCTSISRIVYAATLANSTKGWVEVGSNKSMPYCWGGWSTLSQHINQMVPGSNVQAGDICSSGGVGGDCTPGGNPLPSAPLSCASGIDCSGLVTLAWQLAGKKSTVTLEAISTPMNYSDLQPGDIINKKNKHTRLITTYNPNGSGDVIEASGVDWKTSARPYNPIQQSGYSARCPNSITVVGGCTTTFVNDDCSNAIQLLSSVSCDYLKNQTVNNATPSGNPIASCDSYTGTPGLSDVWYSFQAQSTSHSVTVDPNGSSLDAVIVVYNSCTTSTAVGCNHSSGGSGALTTLNLTGLTIGNYYYVRVYNYGLQTTNGGFQICVTHSIGVGQPDLAYQTATIINYGNNIRLPITVVDSGTGPSIATNIAFALSTSSTFTAPLTMLPSGIIPALNGGATNTQTYYFDFCSLGIPNGTYYVGYYIDYPKPGIVSESNENNNGWWRWSTSPITVNCSLQADLIVQSASTSPTTVSPGGQTSVSCINKNQGTGSSSWSYTAIWLSQDQTFNGSPTDTWLGDMYVNMLNIGALAFNSPIVVDIPQGTPNGNWYIMLGADATSKITESNESNNQVFIPVTIQTCSPPSATITVSGATTFCAGGSVTLSTVNTANRTYEWKNNGNSIPGATASTYIANTSGTYKVTVVNTVTGCSKTSSTGIVVTKNAIPSAIITPQGPTTFCAGGNVILQANTGTGLAYLWKRNGVPISGTLSSKTVSSAGTYKVQVTDNNTGCTKLSIGVVVTVNCRLDNETGQAGSMELYPNPAKGNVTAKFNSNISQNCNLRVTDITGREVMQEQFYATAGSNEHEIDMNNLLEGVYLVHLKNSEGEMIQRIVIE